MRFLILLSFLLLMASDAHAQAAPTCPATAQNTHTITWMGGPAVALQWCVTGVAIKWWAGTFDLTKTACSGAWGCLQPTSPDDEVAVHILLKRWLPHLDGGQITYPPPYGWNHDRTPS